MTLAPASMARLRPSLHDDTGSARGVLHFGIDEQGTPFVEGEVQADLSVTCQRCLQVMPLRIHRRFCLAMVETDEAAACLPERYEPLVLHNGQTDLSDIIEEELLLAMPFAPRHPLGSCTPISWVGGGDEGAQGALQTRQGFAVLATWKPDTGDRTGTT
jgi:uncharacterized protein